MSVHFESHKNLYSDRLEDEILQVVPGRVRLHLHCDDTSTRTPRPLHFNVGFKRAPQVQADKIMQVNIEMWEGCFAELGKCLIQLGGLRMMSFTYLALVCPPTAFALHLQGEA